jgi:carbohydrate diacid regulator
VKIDSKVSRVMLDLSQKIGLEMALLDETDEILVSSSEEMPGLCTEWMDSLNFEDGIARVPETGYTYFMLESENYHPMCVAIRGVSDEVDRYGYLIVTLIDEILHTTLKKPGCEEVFKRIMLDRIDPLELQEAIRDFNIEVDADRCVIIIQTFEGDAASIYSAMTKLFPRKMGDVVVNLNRYVVALVKMVEDSSDMDAIIQLVQAMDETIQNEMAVHACLGVGSIKRGLINIRDSFQEAQEAINLGLMQQTRGRIFLFQRLLLERFLQEVPRDIRRRFYELAYNDSLKKVINEEMLMTVSKFFENNLNLSEAARKLYIHRNTLIYRLEKIQRITGLDLRTFEDAVLLKIIIMLGKSLSSNNRLE